MYKTTFELLRNNELKKYIKETPENRDLEDGIYSLSTDIEVLPVEAYQEKRITAEQETIIKFIQAFPEFVIASAYETETVLLLSKRPEKIQLKRIGSGFNFGSTNLLLNCPQNLLILAEND